MSYRVYQRVGYCYLLDTTHVKILNFIPEIDFSIIILMVLNSCHLHYSLVREHQPILFQKSIPSYQYSIQHTFIQQEVPHPLAHDNINLLLRSWQFFDVLHLPLDHLDHVLVVVQLDDLLGLDDDVTLVDSIYVFSTCLGAEHGED